MPAILHYVYFPAPPIFKVIAYFEVGIFVINFGEEDLLLQTYDVQIIYSELNMLSYDTKIMYVGSCILK